MKFVSQDKKETAKVKFSGNIEGLDSRRRINMEVLVPADMTIDAIEGDIKVAITGVAEGYK